MYKLREVLNKLRAAFAFGTPRSLGFKLIAAFLGVSIGSIALVAVISWFAAANEFNRFVGQQAQNDFVVFVTNYYAGNATLNGLDRAVRVRIDTPPDPTGDQPRFIPFGLADPSGTVVVPSEGYRMGDKVPGTVLVTGTRIFQNGQVIGVVLPRPAPFPRNRAQEQFIDRTLNIFFFAAGGAALVAIVLGISLARTITRPVRELTAAAQHMSKGELGKTVRVSSRDEVGELANAFNRMSVDLQRSDQVRRQMTADIAHELRNPLTVIGGYLDAMRLGDLQPTPQRLDAVYDEIQHLERIVEDLRTLSLADAGALVLDRQPISPRELLQHVAARFAPQAAQKKIALGIRVDPALPTFNLDDARITQVLDNLVSNALHHTKENGAVELGAEMQSDALQITVTDNGEGIPAADLPHVFERFYRGDRARSTQEGSSGLGLAIAQALVRAHGGEITAASVPDHGANFTIRLPT